MRWFQALAAVSTALLLSGCILARDIPYETLEAKYASPGSRFVELRPGLRIHYRDQGRPDGPPLVLVHGFAAALQAWEPWVAELGPRYRIITLDLPGHGLTRTPPGYSLTGSDQVAVVDALTQRLGIESFALGGHSMGGGVAWRYAMAHPERVNALILIDAAGAPVARGASAAVNDKPSVAFQLLANPVGRALLRNVDPRLVVGQGLKSAYVDETLVTPALVKRYSEMARAPDRRRMLTSGRPEDLRPPPLDAFKAITVPTLVMHGEADTVIDVAAGRALAEAIPKAKLITYPGVGHMPMEQIPASSADDLDAFLSTVLANTGARTDATPRRSAPVG